MLFTRTTDLVQRLQIARRDLALEAAIDKLDKYHLLILDDIAYVSKDQAETSVLFELISARYERRSMLITANQPFGEWGRIFPDHAMTLAAIDRLVHHATILEMNVESYRRRTALEQKRGRSPRRPRDAQIHLLIVAPRQSGQNLNNALALPDKQRQSCFHCDRCFSSRLSLASHPDCRATARASATQSPGP